MDKVAVNNIFEQTISKIISITDKDKKEELKAELTTELRGVLQSFLLNIQIYHTQLFNSIVCSNPDSTSKLLKEDLVIPGLVPTIKTFPDPVLPSITNIPKLNISNLDDYDLDQDSNWKDLNDYINLDNIHISEEQSDDEDTEQKVQCSARLNSYKIYNLTKLPATFLDSYPPDVYILNDRVFGDPCLNDISVDLAQSGEIYCWLHRNDPGITNICNPIEHDFENVIYASDA